MTEKKTGRPPKYTEAQVLKGIEIVESNGEAPTGDSVKKAMCAQLGVAGGINAQSLEKEILRLLDERGHERRDRLIAALPPATLAAAKEIGSQVEAAVLGHMGEQHHDLRTSAGEKMTALNADLSNQREQIRGLLSRLDTSDAEIAELEGEKHELQGRLVLAAAKIDSLNERVADLERAEDFQAKMLAVVKETLGQQAKATAV